MKTIKNEKILGVKIWKDDTSVYLNDDLIDEYLIMHRSSESYDHSFKLIEFMSLKDMDEFIEEMKHYRNEFISLELEKDK
jgi:hypothetical protein